MEREAYDEKREAVQKLIHTLEKDEFAQWKADRDDYIDDRNFWDDWEKYEDSEAASLERSLERLQEFRNRGILTWKEYNAEREEILKRAHTYEKGLYEEDLKFLNEYNSRVTAAFKDAISDRKSLLDDEHDANLKRLEKEYDKQKELIDLKIQGIDDEIEARKRLREDEAQDDTIGKIEREIAVLQAKLTYEREDETGENIRDLEKELVRRQAALADALQARDDTEFYRAKAAEKDALNAAKDALSKKETAAKDAAQAAQSASLALLERDQRNELQKLAGRLGASVQSLTNNYTNNTSGAVTTQTIDNSARTLTFNGVTLTAAMLANALNTAATLGVPIKKV
jgi:hypothetical protein